MATEVLNGNRRGYQEQVERLLEQIRDGVEDLRSQKVSGARGRAPAYRVVGQRRLHRLAELVADAPEGVPLDAWPAATAHTVGRRRSM